MAKKVGVNLSDRAYSELEELAARKEKPVTQVVRDAIALEKWFEDTRKKGGKVLVERDGKVQEIVPR